MYDGIVSVIYIYKKANDRMDIFLNPVVTSKEMISYNVVFANAV